MMKKEVLLTISLLASNRKDTIRKCLDSLIPIRKAVSSELIIVDTSGNPEIRSILEEYTDKIIPFTWCNDFAKARNTGLEQAKGEWFLFLDDDEWFIDCKEIIQFFTEGYHKQCGHGTYIVRSFFDKEKLDYSDAELIRLFRLHEGMKFVSKIHEYMTPVSGSCARLKAIAEHSGYYYKTKEEKKKHFERNYKLLVEMLEEEPYNLHLNTQLAQEYFSVDNYEKLYECGKYGLEICNKIESSVVLKEQAGINNIEQCYTQKGTFYIAMLIGLRRTHHLKEGVKIGQQALEDTNMSNLCRACVFINLADCYYQIGSYKEAKNYVEQYLYLAETIPKDEHKYYIEVQALLVSNALQEWQIIKAYSILICCGLKENDLNVLKMYINNLRWDAPKVFVYEMIMEAIIEAMLHNPKEDMFLELLHMIVKQKGLQEGLFVCLRAWELSGRSGWDIIVEKLSKVSITNWHLLWIQAKSGKNEERVAEHLCKLSEEEWEELVKKLITSMDWSDILIIREYLRKSSFYMDIRFSYLEMVLAEIQLVFNEELITITQLETAFYEYAKKAIRYYGYFVLLKQSKLEQLKNEEQEVKYLFVYYTEENHFKALPPSGQAAIYIMCAMQKPITTERFEYLKLAVNIYPSFENSVQKYLKAFKQQIAKERTMQQEMESLKMNIIAQVLTFMDKGQEEEAVAILTQLQKMMPQDEDIQGLMKELVDKKF